MREGGARRGYADELFELQKQWLLLYSGHYAAVATVRTPSGGRNAERMAAARAGGC
jgi:hypothetical protein